MIALKNVSMYKFITKHLPQLLAPLGQLASIKSRKILELLVVLRFFEKYLLVVSTPYCKRSILQPLASVTSKSSSLTQICRLESVFSFKAANVVLILVLGISKLD